VIGSGCTNLSTIERMDRAASLLPRRIVIRSPCNHSRLPIRAKRWGHFPPQRGGSRGAAPMSGCEGEAYPLRHGISATQDIPRFFSLPSGDITSLLSAYSVVLPSSVGVEPTLPAYRRCAQYTNQTQGFEPCLFRPIRPKRASIHPSTTHNF
jgi:hypothetical protein